MPDPRWDALAEILIDHSLQLDAGRDAPDRVLRPARPDAPPPARPEGRRRGARALVETRENRIVRELVSHGSEAPMRAWGEIDRHRMERVQAYLGLRGALEHQRDDRRPAREDGPVQHALPEAGPLRVADHQDPVVRAAAAQPEHGPAGRDEHRGVRGFLLRRLHARLCLAGAGARAPGRPDGRRPRGPDHRAGDGPVGSRSPGSRSSRARAR